MHVRHAYPGDEVMISGWRAVVTAWLATKVGTDQWSDDTKMPPGRFAERVRASIDAGQTFIAVDDDRPVGTMAVDTWSDPGLWSAEELADMVIVHRMIVPRWASGRGVGAVLLEHADEIARQHGRSWVGADVWTTNLALHDYYRHQGFEHLRTEDVDWPSAALFRRPIDHRA